MNLTKLFEAQKALDERILEEKGLHGQDLLPQKVVALITELGECANEWRGFKFWSEDQEPRLLKSIPDMDHFEKTREARFITSNPLLEEYVDCLHFALSLVIETHKGQNLPFHIPASRRLGERIESYFIDIAYSASSILSGNATARIMAAYETLSNVLGLGQALGFTDEQIEAAYFAKNQTNHQRQESGY